MRIDNRGRRVAAALAAAGADLLDAPDPERAGAAGVLAGPVRPAPAPAEPGAPPERPEPPGPPWTLEGRISAADPRNRTMTVNGALFHIPEHVLVKTAGLDQEEGNLQLSALLDPLLPPVVGRATAIACGRALRTGGGDGLAPQVGLEAEQVYVEWARDVVVGPLLGLNPDGSLVVGATKVEMNTDPRFPSRLADGAGSDLAAADLAGREGLQLEAEGYYCRERGALQATAVLARGVVKIPAGADVVTVVRARWRDRELRVEGHVSPAGPGTTVTVHRGGLVNGECVAGAAMGSAAVAGDGTYGFRMRNVVFPRVLCVTSSGGGVAEAPVSNG